MMIRYRMIALVAILLIIPCTASAISIPISLSAKGGIGSAYYSMDELNTQIAFMRQTLGTNFSPLENGFQVYLEGRIWVMGRFAGIVGWEHYWVEAAMDAGSYNLTYKAPTNVFLLGAAVTVFDFPKLVDINLGARGSYGQTIYGTNEFTESSLLEEFKNNDYGWDVFAEVNTNFLRPIEVGMMLGYRNLKIDELVNKYDEVARHIESNRKVVLDFSGMYFYVTAGVRLW